MPPLIRQTYKNRTYSVVMFASRIPDKIYKLTNRVYSNLFFPGELHIDGARIVKHPNRTLKNIRNQFDMYFFVIQ